MMLSRWDLFSEMSRLLELSSTERGSMMRPAVDIYEEKDAIVVKAEIPGVDAKDVDVSVVAEKVAASMHDGVLQLRLPKRATTQPRRIAIGNPSAERRSQA